MVVVPDQVASLDGTATGRDRRRKLSPISRVISCGYVQVGAVLAIVYTKVHVSRSAFKTCLFCSDQAVSFDFAHHSI